MRVFTMTDQKETADFFMLQADDIEATTDPDSAGPIVDILSSDEEVDTTDTATSSSSSSSSRVDSSAGASSSGRSSVADAAGTSSDR